MYHQLLEHNLISHTRYLAKQLIVNMVKEIVIKILLTTQKIIVINILVSRLNE